MGWGKKPQPGFLQVFEGGGEGTDSFIKMLQIFHLNLTISLSHNDDLPSMC